MGNYLASGCLAGLLPVGSARVVAFGLNGKARRTVLRAAFLEFLARAALAKSSPTFGLCRAGDHVLAVFWGSEYGGWARSCQRPPPPPAHFLASARAYGHADREGWSSKGLQACSFQCA